MTEDAAQWDAELGALASPAPLLQSWAWGEVQRKSGWSVERLRLGEAMASVLLRRVGPVTEAYVPRGPVPPTAVAVDELVAHGTARGWARLVVEPEAPEEFAAVLKERDFVSVQPIQPQHTRI